MSIPLSLSVTADTVGWGRMGKVKLQASEIYRKLISGEEEWDGKEFLWIWKAEVSARVKTFFLEDAAI